MKKKMLCALAALLVMMSTNIALAETNNQNMADSTVSYGDYIKKNEIRASKNSTDTSTT